MRLDHSYLSTDYQRYQVAGMATIPQFQSLLETRLDMLIIGLGGGIIPMFIYTHFPNVSASWTCQPYLKVDCNPD